jgi:hypothetical protein
MAAVPVADLRDVADLAKAAAILESASSQNSIPRSSIYAV